MIWICVLKNTTIQGVLHLQNLMKYVMEIKLLRAFFVCCLAHRGSTVGFLLLQYSSGVVRHPGDLRVSVAARSCRVLIFASS